MEQTAKTLVNSIKTIPKGHQDKKAQKSTILGFLPFPDKISFCTALTEMDLLCSKRILALMGLFSVVLGVPLWSSFVHADVKVPEAWSGGWSYIMLSLLSTARAMGEEITDELKAKSSFYPYLGWCDYCNLVLVKVVVGETLRSEAAWRSKQTNCMPDNDVLFQVLLLGKGKASAEFFE